MDSNVLRDLQYLEDELRELKGQFEAFQLAVGYCLDYTHPKYKFKKKESTVQESTQETK